MLFLYNLQVHYVNKFCTSFKDPITCIPSGSQIIQRVVIFSQVRASTMLFFIAWNLERLSLPAVGRILEKVS